MSANYYGNSPVDPPVDPPPPRRVPRGIVVAFVLSLIGLGLSGYVFFHSYAKSAAAAQPAITPASNLPQRSIADDLDHLRQLQAELRAQQEAEPEKTLDQLLADADKEIAA